MGRLYGRPLDENGGIEFRRSPEDAAREADAQLGKKVREMLAKEGSPAGYRREVGDAAGWPDGETVDRLAGAGWNWVRCELLGEEPGSLKTGGAVGETSPWQPIENAPRGVPMIAYGPELERGHIADPGFTLVGIAYFGEEFGWWTHAVNGKGKAAAFDPRKWMPLPLPESSPVKGAFGPCGARKDEEAPLDGR